jgi:hypothetical protein
LIISPLYGVLHLPPISSTLATIENNSSELPIVNITPIANDTSYYPIFSVNYNNLVAGRATYILLQMRFYLTASLPNYIFYINCSNNTTTISADALFGTTNYSGAYYNINNIFRFTGTEFQTTSGEITISVSCNYLSQLVNFNTNANSAYTVSIFQDI